MRRHGSGMQEQLVLSTFSRARNSVMSRTRKAFTPRGLIKDTSENPIDDSITEKSSATQPLDETKIAEPKDSEYDRIKKQQEDERREYKRQIALLGDKIAHLKRAEDEHIQSGRQTAQQIAELEERVTQLKAANEGLKAHNRGLQSDKDVLAETSASYAATIRSLEDKLKASEDAKAGSSSLIQEAEAQVEKLTKELKAAQLTQKNNDNTGSQFQQKLELHQTESKKLAAEIDELKKLVAKLEKQNQDQRKTIAGQEKSLEMKTSEVALLHRKIDENTKASRQVAEELRTKKAEIASSQGQVDELKKLSQQVADELRAKNAQIISLQEHSDKQRGISQEEASQLREKNAELTSLLTSLQKQVDEEKKRYHQEADDLGAKDAVITSLQQHIDEQGRLAQKEADELRAKNAEVTSLLTSLQEQVDEGKQRSHQESDNLQAKDAEISALQVSLAEARTTLAKTTDASSSMLPQTSEADIVAHWQGLVTAVRNLVSENFGNLQFKQIRRWLRSQSADRLPTHAAPAVVGDVFTSHLIEAAIWNRLNQLVFAESTLLGGMCWAGQYVARITKLSGPILQLSENRGDKGHELYHFWKAATANLLTSLVPHETRSERILEVVGDLFALVGDFPCRSSQEEMINNLTSIVDQAVALDDILCRQRSWFFLRYPSQQFDVAVNDTEMERQEGVAPGDVVKFVIRPALCAVSKDSEGSNGLRLLSRHLVYV